MTARLPMLVLGLALALPAGAAEPDAPTIAARSSIVMRLDPRAPQDPRGTVGLGIFRVIARDGYDVEAAGWIGHAPHAANRDAVVSGDVSVLRWRAPIGPAWVEVGRHWTTIGGQRMSGLDGLTAGVTLGEHLELAARGGLSLPFVGDAFGEAIEAGGEARLRFDGGYARVAVLNAYTADTAPRTRWTLAGGWRPDDGFTADGAVTADVLRQAVVDARLDLDAHPISSLRLRGYGRFARIEELLPPTDLLTAFAPDPRGELGALAEWQPEKRWRLRLDGGWVGMREDSVGARWRAAVEWLPLPGVWSTIEGTARVERQGYSGLLRIAGRMPVRGSLFATVEALGDAQAPGGEPFALGGVGRIGLGFEPWAGWLVYGAVDGAQTPRWRERLGGVVVVEHALGAPVRWGGGP